MTLLFLLLLLLIPFLLLTLLGRLVPRLEIAPSNRARVGLSLFFLVTAMAHFASTREMAEMVPPFIPYRVELIYLTVRPRCESTLRFSAKPVLFRSEICPPDHE